jgi:hypothetical protein
LVLGAGLGIVADATGVAALARRDTSKRGTAIVGVVLGFVSIAVGLGFLYWFRAHQLDHYHQRLIDGN